MRYVSVESHSFKERFTKDDVPGFVVCAALPSHDRSFAEIYGSRDCYYIFEDFAEAELHSTFASDKLPPGTEQSVMRVTVSDIRDYQVLNGRKTVLLVNREGQITWSLRVGDMPLAARTNNPFSESLRVGGMPSWSRSRSPLRISGETRSTNRPQPNREVVILRWGMVTGVVVVIVGVMSRSLEAMFGALLSFSCLTCWIAGLIHLGRRKELLMILNDFLLIPSLITSALALPVFSAAIADAGHRQFAHAVLDLSSFMKAWWWVLVTVGGVSLWLTFPAIERHHGHAAASRGLRWLSVVQILVITVLAITIRLAGR